jgi:uncharacterized small protein (DUF1192 family)
MAEIACTDDSEAHIARHGVTPRKAKRRSTRGLGWSLRERRHPARVRHDRRRRVPVRRRGRSDGRPGLHRHSTRNHTNRATAFPSERALNTTEIERLRAYYDETYQSEALAQAVPEEGVTEVLVSTSILLPKALMDQVRERATEAGVPATALMRQWIADRLDPTDDAAAVVSVAELEQFIAARAHPAAS